MDLASTQGLTRSPARSPRGSDRTDAVETLGVVRRLRVGEFAMGSFARLEIRCLPHCCDWHPMLGFHPRRVPRQSRPRIRGRPMAGAPTVVTLTLVTQPSGLQLTLDGQLVNTPYAVESVVGTRGPLAHPRPSRWPGALTTSWSGRTAVRRLTTSPHRPRIRPTKQLTAKVHGPEISCRAAGTVVARSPRGDFRQKLQA